MLYIALGRTLSNIEKIMLKLKEGFDLNKTYFQYRFIKNKIPTVFIHGVGLDNTMWYPQKEYFVNKSILFYDILNHGKSTKKNKKLNFDLFSNQLIGLIDFLKLKKINLVGFSIGALIAQHFTEKYFKKINKLALIASVYKRRKNEIAIVANRFNEALKGKSITEDSIRRWFSKEFLIKNKEVHQFFYELLEKKENVYFLPAYKVFVESDKYEINYKNFNMPTLIMTGENEIGSTPRMSQDIHNEIQNSQLHIIKNAKHGVTIEKRESVNKKLSDFLF